jgi:hypothetical protein
VRVVPDGASAVTNAGSREPGGSPPGLSSIEALHAAQRTLADANARIAALLHDRSWIDREIGTWQEIVRSSQALIDYHQRRLQESPSLLDSQPLTPARTRKGSSERFGAIIVPIADRLIEARAAPVPVEDIIAAVPAQLREELDAAATVDTAPVRIRRMFRRNKKYKVSDAGVTFANMVEHPRVPRDVTVTHLVRRKDGSIAAIAVADDAGHITNIKPAEVRAALRANQTIMLPEMHGRQSRLRLAGGRFYSEVNGSENNDFFQLPEVAEEATHGDRT